MSQKDCVVLVQSREASEYNDFIGKYYHFPQKYKNLLSRPNLEFIYYEPKKTGSGTYFGYGKLGRVFSDKREDEHYFIEITEYKAFAEEVPFYDKDGSPREKGPGYNAQNAVRNISPEELEEICLDGGILLNFNADVHLIKVLGEELIASEVVGILELIKNSYDANATYCGVRIEKIPGLLDIGKENYMFADLPGPVIVIEDDGIGMDRQTIEYGWFRPASTIKTQVKEILRSEKEAAFQKGSYSIYNSLVKELKEKHGGRLPLGEKGVGRFATHRLGSNVIIKTKTSENDYEFIIEVDWHKFEHYDSQQKDLNSIGISLKRQPPTRNYGKRDSGTQIIVCGGRKGYDLTEEIVKDIHRSISKLKSPHRAPQTFNITFDCPQLPDLVDVPIEQEVTPVFTLDALVDEDGIADFELKFNPPEDIPLSKEVRKVKKFDLRAKDETNPLYWLDSSKNIRRSMCGPFFLHIDIWYRSIPWISPPQKKIFTQYLDEYGGISIYRDGLNILPAEWGAEVDWLRLSKRHIKKGLNLSYYNMIGQLEIEQSSNLDIIDKTDRQGFINNPAMRDLATLTRRLVFYVENDFKGKRDRYTALTSGLIREPKKLGEITMQGSMLVDNIIKRYDIAKDVSSLLTQYKDPDSRKDNLINLRDSLKNLSKSMEALQDVQDLLSEQAGYGLAIGVAVHEIAKITSNFYNGVAKLLKSKSFDEKCLQDLMDSSASLKSEIKRLAPLRAIRSESSVAFKISKAINFCNSVFDRTFKKEQIVLKIDKQGDFSVYCRYGLVNQVLSNLLDNSCYWLSKDNQSQKSICIILDGTNRRLIVADNGPDIDDSIRPYLFEPGYSLKVPPSGLGLYICKYYMKSVKGNIYEAGQKDRIPGMKGAQFVLDFSRVPSEG